MKTYKASHEEATMFRLIGLLIQSGASFLEAVTLAATEFPAWKEPLMAVHHNVKNGGKMVSDVLREYTTLFSPYTPDVVHAGEMSGSLEITLIKLGRIIEREAVLRESGAPQEAVAAIMFHRLLAIMTRTQCALGDSLKVAVKGGLSQEAYNHIFNEVMKEGNTFRDGISRSPAYFDGLSFTYVDIGEQTGAFPEMNDRVADLREQLVYRSIPCGLCPGKEALDDIADYELVFVLLEHTNLPSRVLIRLVEEGNIKRKSFKVVAEKMAAGSKISEAMASMPEEFPSYIVRLIELGEENESVPAAFAVIADFLKWKHLGIESNTRNALVTA